MRNITGGVGAVGATDRLSGAFYATSSGYNDAGASYTRYMTFFDASRVVPTAEHNRPPNVAQPVILYLGRPA